MSMQKALKRQDYFTFKANLKETRYGWLRLTPAYSAHLVAELLSTHEREDLIVLDPFCGTGTTSLVCAERGITCDTTDINPFLLWLTKTKTQVYDNAALDQFKEAADQVLEDIYSADGRSVWTPSLHQIEKWWGGDTLKALGRAMQSIDEMAGKLPEKVSDLLKLAFCQTMIDRANVSFGHQSMSFQKRAEAPMLSIFYSEKDLVGESWLNSIAHITASAQLPIMKPPLILYCDARSLSIELAPDRYTCVITSPPYPNRVSYIRELRPYMYWLRYINDGSAAGALDKAAIGGTWGSATSSLMRWAPQPDIEIPSAGFECILNDIAERSLILSRYVHKYFQDMVLHCTELYRVSKSAAWIYYIVGNSKFYDVLLPVEEIYADLFRAVGFCDVSVKPLRKRTSKKELYEFLVSARKP